MEAATLGLSKVKRARMRRHNRRIPVTSRLTASASPLSMTSIFSTVEHPAEHMSLSNWFSGLFSKKAHSGATDLEDLSTALPQSNVCPDSSTLVQMPGRKSGAGGFPLGNSSQHRQEGTSSILQDDDITDVSRLQSISWPLRSCFNLSFSLLSFLVLANGKAPQLRLMIPKFLQASLHDRNTQRSEESHRNLPGKPYTNNTFDLWTDGSLQHHKREQKRWSRKKATGKQ